MIERIIILTLALILFTGCVKDTIYNTDHPDKVEVTLSTGWSDRGAGVEKPSSYTVESTGVSEVATSDKFTLTHLFEPGKYPFYLHNNIMQIQVSNGVAKVITVIPPVSDAGTFIEPLPGWLFSGYIETELEKDSNYELDISMHQQVRQLTLLLEPEGGSADRITSITGYLTGVAGEFDIESKEHGSASSVELMFTRITEGSNAGKWTCTVRLLGVTGAEQKLRGTINLSGGSPSSISLESDLSPELSGFNGNKSTPLALGGEIIEIHTPAGFTATIVDWVKVNSGTGIAQ